MSKFIVIGGGASGLVAAINLRRNNNEVTILEKNEKCGKKLLATGNGHCNYYNKDQNVIHYHSDSPTLIKKIINRETNKLVLNFFDGLGIIPKIRNDYYYPYSNMAISIQNTLVNECIRLGVKIEYNANVLELKKVDSGFDIKTEEKKYFCDKVVVASGSSASLKGEVNTYEILEKFGHNIIDIHPALTRLNLNEPFLKDWSGIRNDCKIKLLVNDELVKEEEGEILYTSNGISGICTMQISNLASKNLWLGNRVDILINNLPEFCKSRNDFIKFMDERSNLLKNYNISELLDSIINYKLVNVLLKRVGIKNNTYWNKLDDRSKNILASSFVDMRLSVISTDPISKAQTISGGVRLEEVNLKTMESKIVDGLYIIGEALDINGDCGGYNLTIAWTTGLLVGGYNA